MEIRNSRPYSCALRAKRELHNVSFPVSDTHYCTLQKNMPLRNFYGNAFSLIGNANISASSKKWNKKLLYIPCILMFRSI